MAFAAIGSAIASAVVEAVVAQVVQAVVQAIQKAATDSPQMQDAPPPTPTEHQQLADQETRQKLAQGYTPGAAGADVHQMRAFHTNEFASGVSAELARSAPKGVSSQDLVEEFKRGNAGLVNQMAAKLNVDPQVLYDAVKSDLDTVHGVGAASGTGATSGTGAASQAMYSSRYDGTKVDHSDAIGGYHKEAPSAEIWAGQFYHALKVANPDGTASVRQDTLGHVVDQLKKGGVEALRALADKELKGLQASANAYDGDLKRFLSEVASSLEKVNANSASARGGGARLF